MSKKVYLAIPYSFNPELSHRVANFSASRLMEVGDIVFSPISHSHLIADHLRPETRFDHEFWMKQDLPLLAWADEVVVINIGDNEEGMKLIKQSRGVQEEILTAQNQGKPVWVMGVTVRKDGGMEWDDTWVPEYQYAGGLHA
jgi:hypothetical protein